MDLIHNDIKKNEMDAIVGVLLYGQLWGIFFLQSYISEKKEDIEL